MAEKCRDCQFMMPTATQLTKQPMGTLNECVKQKWICIGIKTMRLTFTTFAASATVPIFSAFALFSSSSFL